MIEMVWPLLLALGGGTAILSSGVAGDWAASEVKEVVYDSSDIIIGAGMLFFAGVVWYNYMSK